MPTLKRIAAVLAAVAGAAPLAPPAAAYDEICLRNDAAAVIKFKAEFRSRERGYSYRHAGNLLQGADFDDANASAPFNFAYGHKISEYFGVGETRCLSMEESVPGDAFVVVGLAADGSFCKPPAARRGLDGDGEWHPVHVWPEGGGRLNLRAWGHYTGLRCEIESGERMWPGCAVGREGFRKSACYSWRPRLTPTAAYDLAADDSKSVAYLASAARRGADLNALKNGERPLHAAVRLNRPDHARALLGMGDFLGTTPRRADTSLTNSAGETPLLLAARLGRWQHLRDLLAASADPDAPDADGRTPLLTAIDAWPKRRDLARAVYVLMDEGADPDRPADNGDRPLHRAALHGRADVVRALLDDGADPRPRDGENKTALDYAGRVDTPARREIAARLYREELRLALGAQPNIARVAALAAMAENDWADPNQDFPARRRRERLPPLLLAYANGIPDAATHLAGAAGINLNAADAGGRTAIYHAIARRHDDSLRALLENGADPNLEFNNGVAPIEAAAEAPSEAAVALLINAGADLEVLNDDGETPLLVAAKNNRPAVVRLLLQGGAKTDAADPDGRTALDHATLGGHHESERPLIRAGAARSATADSDRAVTQADERGDTPLHRLAAANNIARLRAALRQQPRVNARNQNGETPLLHAILANEPGTNLSETARALLDAGADFRLTSAEGRAPPDAAAEKNMPEVLRAMLERGLHPDEKDSRPGWPPLAHAVFHDAVDAVRLLLRHGANPDATADGAASGRSAPEILEGDHDMINHAAHLNFPETALALLQAGASQWRPAPDGKNPQIRAALAGRDELLSRLIERGEIADAPEVRAALANARDFPLSAAAHGRGPARLRPGETPSANHLIDLIRRNPADRDLIHDALRRGRAPWAAGYPTGDPNPNETGAGGFSALHAAARDSEAALRLMLDPEAESVWPAHPNLRDETSGASPLHWAVNPSPLDGSSAPGRARLLLENGADANAQDRRGDTPLHLAAARGHSVYFKLLLENGADPALRNRSGLTAADLAQDDAAREELTAALAATAAARPQGRRSGAAARLPLHSAVLRDDLAEAAALLEQGADANRRDSRGNTPLQAGIASGELSREMAALLLENDAELYRRNDVGDTPLSAAAARGMAEIVAALIDAGARADYPRADDRLPLHLAAGHGLGESRPAADADFAAAAAALLRAPGADADAPAPDGQTPLKLAMRANDPAVVSALLAAGAAAAAPDSDGQAPAVWAARNKRAAILDLLLEGGADPEGLSRLAGADDDPEVTQILGSRGFLDRPLRAAAEAGDAELVVRLLRHGADPGFAGPDGKTALEIAVVNGREEMISPLLDGGASAAALPDDWTLAGIPNLRAETVTRLLDGGAPLNFGRLNELGQNPVHLAVIANAPDLIRRFIAAAHVSDLRLRDNDGRTPFDHSLEGRRREAAELLEDFNLDPDAAADAGRDGLPRLHQAARDGDADETTRWIRLGANPEMRDADDETALTRMALDVAAGDWREGHSDSARALLRAGAQVDSAGPRGETALHKAARAGNPALMEILLEHGADPKWRNDAGRTARDSFDDGAASGLHHAGLGERARLILRGAVGRAENLAALRAGVAENNGRQTEQALRRMTAEELTPELLEGLLERALFFNSEFAALALADATAARTDLERAALLNIQGREGETVLHHAALPRFARGGRIGLYALAGADTEIADNQGRTPLAVAIENRNLDAVLELLAGGAETGPAEAAARQAGGRYAELVIADPNASPENGFSLMQAAARDLDLERLRQLLERGGDANGAMPDGTPFLFAAALDGSAAMAEILLEHGADANALMNGANVAHHMAVNGIGDPGDAPRAAWADLLEVARVLAGGDIDWNAADNDGHRPLDYLLWRVEVGIGSGDPDGQQAALALADFMRERGATCAGVGRELLHPACGAPTE